MINLESNDYLKKKKKFLHVFIKYETKIISLEFNVKILDLIIFYSTKLVFIFMTRFCEVLNIFLRSRMKKLW